MLVDAMQILAGRVADIADESLGFSQRSLATCPIRAGPRISWMRAAPCRSSDLF